MKIRLCLRSGEVSALETEIKTPFFKDSSFCKMAEISWAKKLFIFETRCFIKDFPMKVLRIFHLPSSKAVFSNSAQYAIFFYFCQWLEGFVKMCYKLTSDDLSRRDNFLKYKLKKMSLGKTKNQKIGRWGLVLAIPLFFAGCSISGKPDGGLYKSADGGKNFSQKTQVGEKISLSNQSILTLELDPQNSQILYLGTDQLGILRSSDGGESWVRDSGNYNTVTAIAVSRQNSEVIYFAGKKGDRGKVFKSINGGREWQEIYTEKSDGTIVTALALDKDNDNDLLIGNSGGGIFHKIGRAHV